MKLRPEFIPLVLVLFMVSVRELSAASVEAVIAGRPVEGNLVKAEDLSPAKLAVAGIKLTIESEPVQAGSNVFDLLTKNGIVPDVEAFTVVYDLNPSLEKIDPLPAGFTIVVPKADGGEDLKAIFREGYLLMLTVDPIARDELGKRVAELRGLAARFSHIPLTRFESEAAMASTKANVNALSVWLDNTRTTFLHRTGPPLRQQTLFGIRDETAALDAILAAILDGNGKVISEDRQEIDSIYRDIEAQLKKYDNVMAGEPPTAEKRYEVIVVIRNGERLKDAQVYYAYEGLFRKPPKEPYASRPLEKASSGYLTFGDYVIWAGRPDHPFPPLTDQKPIRIEAGGGATRSIELSVLQ